MGTNKYGHLGAIESGHAVYAVGYLADDAFAGRGEFTPWTMKYGTDWTQVQFGTSARDMLAATPALAAKVEAVNLGEFMLGIDLANEHQALIRYGVDGSQRLLGMKKSEGLIQAGDVADMADAFVEAARMLGHEQAGVITAFEMDMGKKFVVCADLGSADWFGGSLRGLISCHTSWDGSWKSKVIENTVVSQCTNTVSMNLLAARERGSDKGRGEEQLIAFKNTSGVADRWTLAQRMVTAVAGKWAMFRENAISLVETPITERSFRDMVRLVLGERPQTREDGKRGKCPAAEWDKRFDAIVSEWKADHNEYCRGTAFGAIMAANGYDLWLDGARDPLKAQVEDLYVGRSAVTERMLEVVTDVTAWQPVAV